MAIMNNFDGESSIQFHVTSLILKMRDFSSRSLADIQFVVFIHYKTT